MKFADVKEGDMLIADGGFTCIKEDARLNVKENEDGDLYVPCESGQHFLDGQIDYDNGALVGFSRPKKGKPT